MYTKRAEDTRISTIERKSTYHNFTNILTFSRLIEL